MKPWRLIPGSWRALSQVKVRSYGTYTEEVENELKSHVGATHFIGRAQEAEIIPYETGERGEKSTCLAVVKPQNEEQLLNIFATMREHTIPATIFGGNSGLAKTTVSHPKNKPGITISMEAFNKGYYQEGPNNTAIVTASMTPDEINHRANQSGKRWPLYFGARSQAQLGGAIATRTAGLAALLHGSAREMLKTVTAITPAGETIVQKIAPQDPKKQQDNSDLGAGLLPGSAGLLGVITEAEIILKDRPKQSHYGIFIANSIDDIEKIRTTVLSTLEEINTSKKEQAKTTDDKEKYQAIELSAFEGAPIKLFNWSCEARGVPHFFKEDTTVQPEDYSITIQLDSYQSEQDDPLINVMEEIYEALDSNKYEKNEQDKKPLIKTAYIDSSHIDETGFTNHDTPEKGIMSIRENISPTIKQKGMVLAGDVGVKDVAMMSSFIQETKARISKLVAEISPTTEMEYTEFGHFGKGTIHFNMLFPNNDLTDELKEAIKEELFACVEKYEGPKTSAEHGTGLETIKFFVRYVKEERQLALIKAKEEYDPECLLGNALWIALMQERERQNKPTTTKEEEISSPSTAQGF